MAVLEVADIRLKDGTEDAFISAYGQARALVAGSAGVGAIRMTRSIETPTRFVLLIEWDSVDAHQVFRDSPRFGEWRALIGPYFAEPPFVEHVSDIA